MLQRLPAYRDPLIELLSDALTRALDVYRRSISSNVSIEFECRLGTFSASRHNFTHAFQTHSITPTLLNPTSTVPFFFFAGVAQPTFINIHEALKSISPIAVPPRSSTILSVRTAGKERLEYAMNNTLCNSGKLLAAIEKERIFSHDIRCPNWAADFRISVARETIINAREWEASQWENFTPTVSRLRQRKTININSILAVDIAMVRSFTDHSRFTLPWSPELQIPFISAPELTYDVELEVNLPQLHRMIKKTRMLDSVVGETAENILTVLKFLTIKREGGKQ